MKLKRGLLKNEPGSNSENHGSVLSIFNLISDIVWSVGLSDYKTLILSPSAEDLYEVPYEKLFNEHDYWKKAVYPEDKDVIQKIIKKLDVEGSYLHEYRIKTRSGKIKWVRQKGEIVYNSNNKPIRLDRVITDITEEKQTVYRLITQEERYRNIIANMDLGYLEVDNDDIIQYANQSFIQMSGYTLNELKGKKAAELFLSKKSKQVVIEKHRNREGGKSDSYEIIVNNKQGESRRWLISGAPNYNDEGEITGSVGIHLDVTAKYELSKAKENAEAANRAKSEFLANMSHEIRTPLNAVIGFSDLLKRTPLNDTQKQYMSTVFNSANSLLDIISDILDFSKIEAGKLELDIDKTDLQRLGEQVTDIIRYQAQEKGLKLILNVPSSLPRFIYADPVRLRQVLINLLSNAVKFTERGEIEFKVEKVKAYKDDRIKFRFSVRDSGIGIAPQNQKKIFEAFLQEDSSTTRNYGGTGLGLTIANNLLALMDSKLELTSKLGNGSTFYFDVIFNSIEGDSDGVETQKSKKGPDYG